MLTCIKYKILVALDLLWRLEGQQKAMARSDRTMKQSNLLGNIRFASDVHVLWSNQSPPPLSHLGLIYRYIYIYTYLFNIITQMQ